MAAIDNATAVPEGANDQRTTATSEHVARTSVGLGATEVERRELSQADVRGLLYAQVDERLAAADEYLSLGRHDRADQLRAEADVFRGYLRDATVRRPARRPRTATVGGLPGPRGAGLPRGYGNPAWRRTLAANRASSRRLGGIGRRAAVSACS